MDQETAKKIQKSVKDFYEKYGAAFARTRGMNWAEENLIAECIQANPLSSPLSGGGLTVVDVGAGNGRFAKLLPLDKGGGGISYIGFEPSSTLRAAGARHAVPLREGGFPHVPIDDATADATICLAVLHHLATDADRQNAVVELLRITKPGGLIAASAWWVLPLTEGDSSPSPSSTRRGTDMWIPWRAEGADAKRFVHVFNLEEWKSLWTHPQLEIERIGLFGKKDWTDDAQEARNFFMMGRKK